ncbi:MAG TPA: hypothetical protein VFT20_16130 [Candidatus Limnocylindrales bacterium]|nr:hypothetical protein [Candidatus Limnocylindrales bacterium]
MTDRMPAGRPTRTRARARSASVALAVLLLASGCGLAGGLPGVPQREEGVRGSLGGYFLWGVGAPTRSVPPIEQDDAAALVDDALAVIEPGRDPTFSVSILSAFDTTAEAEEQAAEIRTILGESAAWYADAANAAARRERDDPDTPAPFTPPEVAALKANLLAPGERGIGWGGEPDDAEAAVYTLGPVLFVTGLKYEHDGNDAPPLHPLAHVLAAAGGDVLLEGEEKGWGPSSVVVDVSCRPADEATGAALLDALGDAIVTTEFHTRPPWLGPPLTASEALARATYRRWLEGTMDAMSDPRYLEFAERLQSADEAEIEATMREFAAWVAEEGLAEMEGELDPEVLALLVSGSGETDMDERARWAVDVGRRMGQLPLEATEWGERPTTDDYERTANVGALRLNDGRLEVGWLGFGRVAFGLPLLAGWLTERGCDDLRVGFADFDDVRGD